MKFIFTASIFLLGIGFTHASAQSLLKGGKVPRGTEITLERGACFGRCPIYSLKITSDGRVRFLGQSYTGTQGKATGRISDKNLRSIISEFEKARFFEMKSRYQSGKDCGVSSTDSPSVTVSIKIRALRKSVYFYLGCQNAPNNISARMIGLSKKIDEAANAEQWVNGWKPPEK